MATRIALRSSRRILVRNTRRVALPTAIGARSLTTQALRTSPPSGSYLLGTGFVLGLATLHCASDVDYNQVRKDIADILEKEGYDDGSYGPVFVRLAWHQAGTYSKADGSGGSEGGRIRFDPEKSWGANAGLTIAMEVLEKVKEKHPNITYADLYSLAGTVAIEEMGGPKIAWRPGRKDLPDGSTSPPDGRLPDASQGAQHLRDIFYRMGFNDQDIVALSGAHALGRCHSSRSGFEGPWTKAPTVFSNEYFRELVENEWSEKKWKGPRQFEDKKKELMMLPTDMVLLDDPEFKKWVKVYYEDEDKFFVDFAKAWTKLQENGVGAFQKRFFFF